MMKGVKSEPGTDCSDQKPSNNPVIASIAAASSENAPFQGKENDLMISTGIREDHRKIPNSNETVNKVQVKRKKPTATTSEQEKKATIVVDAKPSASSKNMYRKWQMAAEEMGFMGQIIVDKVQAKQIVFDWLHDQFKPKPINDIYKALKASVPSPILKFCLDEMSIISSISDKDNVDPCKHLTEITENTLFSKLSRHSNSTLYFANYSTLKNDGNGLSMQDRGKLEASLHQTIESVKQIQARQANIMLDVQKLLLTPKNAEVDVMLSNCQSDVKRLNERLELYRTFEDNGRKRKIILSNINHFASHWKKRRHICMEVLNMLQDCTEGAISVKKCLSGAGQIEIDSDEFVSKQAWESALNKKKYQLKVSNNSTFGTTDVAEQHELISVRLLPNGSVDCVYFSP